MNSEEIDYGKLSFIILLCVFLLFLLIHLRVGRVIETNVYYDCPGVGLKEYEYTPGAPLKGVFNVSYVGCKFHHVERTLKGYGIWYE